MPTRYVIDKHRRVVVSTGWDRVTFAELQAHENELLRDPDFNAEFDQLIDATAVAQFDVSHDEVKMIAARKVFSATSRRAFVAGSSFIYGMGRMISIYAELSGTSVQAKVFTDLPSARQWLGLERE